jgi:hypothetical protein
MKSEQRYHVLVRTRCGTSGWHKVSQSYSFFQRPDTEGPMGRAGRFSKTEADAIALDWIRCKWIIRYEPVDPSEGAER